MRLPDWWMQFYVQSRMDWEQLQHSRLSLITFKKFLNLTSYIDNGESKIELHLLIEIYLNNATNSNVTFWGPSPQSWGSEVCLQHCQKECDLQTLAISIIIIRGEPLGGALPFLCPSAIGLFSEPFSRPRSGQGSGRVGCSWSPSASFDEDVGLLQASYSVNYCNVYSAGLSQPSMGLICSRWLGSNCFHILSCNTCT